MLHTSISGGKLLRLVRIQRHHFILASWTWLTLPSFHHSISAIVIRTRLNQWCGTRYMDTRRSKASVDLAALATAPEAEGAASIGKALLNLPSPEICVICLDLLRAQATDSAEHDEQEVAKGKQAGRSPLEPAQSLATALPCKHSEFHFPCLGTWLTHSRFCPLCKATVHAISLQHDDQAKGKEIIPLPDDAPSSRKVSTTLTQQSRARHQQHRHRGTKRPSLEEDPVIVFRRTLYERQIPSLYRGRGVTRTPASLPNPISPSTSNRHSAGTSHPTAQQAQDIPKRSKRPLRPPPPTASSFQPSSPASAHLTRLATTWIRRELSLFPFLNPTSPAPTLSNPTNQHQQRPSASPRRRQTTAPFLTNYILLILQHIDLWGSAGQAIELIAEYLGQSAATLFVHELRAVLGSGVGSVQEWDEDEGLMYWFEEEAEIRDGMGRLIGRLHDGEG